MQRPDFRQALRSAIQNLTARFLSVCLNSIPILKLHALSNRTFLLNATFGKRPSGGAAVICLSVLRVFVTLF